MQLAFSFKIVKYFHRKYRPNGGLSVSIYLVASVRNIIIGSLFSKNTLSHILTTNELSTLNASSHIDASV